MEYIIEVIKAVCLLIQSLIIFLVFWVARYFGETSKLSIKWTYFWTVSIVLFCSMSAAYTLGSYADYSGPGGSPEIVTEYEPTDEQKIKHGIFFFTEFIVPALFGIFKGLNKRNLDKILIETISPEDK